MWPRVCFQLLISKGLAFSGMKTNQVTLLRVCGASRLFSLFRMDTRSL